jgi:acyl carrier protein
MSGLKKGIQKEKFEKQNENSIISGSMQFSKKIFIDDIHDSKYIYRGDEQAWLDLDSYQQLEDHIVEVLKTADKENFPTDISFDFDLGYRSRKNGLGCLSLVIDVCKRYGINLPTCHVHSGNPFAIDKFKEVLEGEWKEPTGNEYQLIKKYT